MAFKVSCIQHLSTFRPFPSVALIYGWEKHDAEVLENLWTGSDSGALLTNWGPAGDVLLEDNDVVLPSQREPT